MTNKEFEEILINKRYGYRIKKGSVIVTHHEYVVLNDIRDLPAGVQFNNQGNLYLNDLKTLPAGVQFNNKGFVSLKHLKTLSQDVKFNNKTTIFCDMLEGKHTYLGRELEFKCIDDCTMIIDSKEMIGEYELYNARFFQGKPVEDMTKRYVVKMVDHYVHWETKDSIIKDIDRMIKNEIKTKNIEREKETIKQIEPEDEKFKKMKDEKNKIKKESNTEKDMKEEKEGLESEIQKNIEREEIKNKRCFICESCSNLIDSIIDHNSNKERDEAFKEYKYSRNITTLEWILFTMLALLGAALIISIF